MPSVQSGDGQDVHDSQDDADEGGEMPEGTPVPGGREDAAYGDEGPHALGSLLGEYVFQVMDIARELVPAVAESGRYALNQAVANGIDLDILGQLTLEDAQTVVGSQVKGVGIAQLSPLVRVAVVADDHGAQGQGVGRAAGNGQLVLDACGDAVKVCPAAHTGAVDGGNAGMRYETSLESWSVGHYGVYVGRHEGGHDGRCHLGHLQHVGMVLRHLEGHLTPSSQDGHLTGFAQGAQDAGVPVLEGFAVDGHRDVTIHKTHLVTGFIEDETRLDMLHGNDLHAPHQHYGTVDDETGEEVHEHATHHDEEAFPHGLRTELIGLGGLLHLFGVHRLVYHAGYLDISTQGNPSDAVFRLVGSYAGEAFGKPLVLGAEEVKLGIEEEVELLDTHLEELGEEEVSALMQDHQKAEAAEQLGGFDQEYIHVFVFV